MTVCFACVQPLSRGYVAVQMRLLNAKSLELREFTGRLVPPNVILSHRWEDDEVSLQDMLEGRTKQKGYAMIKGLCDTVTASTDHPEWVWVDTCCIYFG